MSEIQVQCSRGRRLTVLVQSKVVLSVAKLLRSTGDEDVVLTEEVLEAGHLRGHTEHRSNRGSLMSLSRRPYCHNITGYFL